MAFDPEEFKQRRQEKEQQRRQKQRGLIVRLLIAAVVLVLILVLILTVVGQKKPSEQPQVQEPVTDVIEEQTPLPEQTVIHLAAAGDLNVTAKAVEAGGVSYDYTGAFLDVAHLLADADVTTINFEGNLYGQPYGEDRSAPQNMANALSNAGVDIVQLANSYSIYKGMQGLSQTINGIRLAGMEPVGAYANSQEANQKKGYTIHWVQGVKIAFVAFTKGMDGMALPAGNEGCVNVLYTDYATDYRSVDTAGIRKVLDAAAKEKPDITIALVHWGSEFNDTISDSQKKICNLLQEEGVDAIIGTHSHYVQKMEFDKEKGTFVAYSLGDFFGDASRSGSEYSVILDLEITKDNASGATKITNFSYTPIFTVHEENKPLRVMRIAETMKAYENSYIDSVSEQTYKDMAYALTRIEARINGK